MNTRPSATIPSRGIGDSLLARGAQESVDRSEPLPISSPWLPHFAPRGGRRAGLADRRSRGRGGGVVMWVGLHFYGASRPWLWTSRRGPRAGHPGARCAWRCRNFLETSGSRGRLRARAGGGAGTAAHMKAYIVFSSVVIRVTAPLESMARKLPKPPTRVPMPCSPRCGRQQGWAKRAGARAFHSTGRPQSG